MIARTSLYCNKIADISCQNLSSFFFPIQQIFIPIFIETDKFFNEIQDFYNCLESYSQYQIHSPQPIQNTSLFLFSLSITVQQYSPQYNPFEDVFLYNSISITIIRFKSVTYLSIYFLLKRTHNNR